MKLRTRVVLHVCFAVVMASLGLFVCSFLLFPSVWPNQTKPIAPLAGVACGLFFVGVPGLAGLGLGVATDLFRGVYSLEKLPRDKIIDLIAGTQYLLVGLALVMLHFMQR